MREVREKVARGGRIVIPAAYRKALGISEGDDIVLRLEDGEMRLFTPAEAIRRAQALVREHIPAGGSLADELIAERRREARHE